MTLSLDHVTIRRQNQNIVANLSLKLRSGLAYALMGANGAGKTSFLQAIAGLLPYSGKIEWSEARKNGPLITTYLPTPYQRDWPYTAKEIVLMGRYSHGYRSTPTSRDLQALSHALSACQAEHLADRRFLELSTGEQQRLLIARTIATDAPIWLLDEPTTGLDPYHRANIWTILKKMTESGRLLVFTTHYFNEAESLGDQTLILENGCLTVKKEAPSEANTPPKRLAPCLTSKGNLQVFSRYNQ